MGIKRIAVIGLGMMGTPIAALLLKAGYSVTGHDIVKKRMDDLVPQGMKPAASPGQAVKDAELIILSLPNWKSIQDVVAGKAGILKGIRKGQIIADMSTSPPEGTIAMAKTMASRGVDWMDIPISGSSAQARVGNMVFMAGGKKSVYKKVKPVLEKIGKKSVHAGRLGDGAMLKLVVNLILYLNEAAAVEGLTLGMKAGLDPDIMLDVITTGAASSDLIMARGKDMLAGRFSPKGQVGVAVKDMGLIVERAKQMGVMLPVGGLYQQLLLQAQYLGWDGEDATAVLKIYEQWAGIVRPGR